MEKNGKILIIDDNEDVLFALNLLLEPVFEKIKVTTQPDRIRHFMETFRPDVILLDMNFCRDAISGQEGFEYLGQILTLDPQAVVVFMTAYVITFPEYKTEEISGAFFGMCYVSVLMSYVYLTRMYVDGIYTVWLILLSSWGCDTAAYCVGMLIGRHKMTPALSPKKSWEGAVGGVLGAAALGFIFAMVFADRMGIDSPVFSCVFACGIGAVISQIGDLAASAIKRNHNIKDYGNIIPGHGGILDRFDSMLFTAPAIYYAINFAVNILK